jgi:hypothetical protein
VCFNLNNSLKQSFRASSPIISDRIVTVAVAISITITKISTPADWVRAGASRRPASLPSPDPQGKICACCGTKKKTWPWCFVNMYRRV